MTLFWGRVECEAAVGSNVRSVPPTSLATRSGSKNKGILKERFWNRLNLSTNLFQIYHHPSFCIPENVTQFIIRLRSLIIQGRTDLSLQGISFLLKAIWNSFESPVSFVPDPVGCDRMEIRHALKIEVPRTTVEVSAQRCKTCVELASPVLVDRDFHFQN